MSFIEELKRRNVFRVGIAYVVGAWLLLQAADILFEAFAAPDWSLRLLVILLILGLPVALFFAWAFELTPEGIKRESQVDRSQSITHHTGRKLDRAIIAVLALALGYFVVDKFVLQSGAPPDTVDVVGQPDAASGDGGEVVTALPTDKSIAVLPFEHRSSVDEDRFFTSGIHDDLLTQLAQISSLRVISRTSVAQFENTDKPIREIAELLNVSTILEGGVQRAGNQVRINLQLIDAATDAHLWAKTYDRELTASNVFAIQSEIATAVTEAMRATLSPPALPGGPGAGSRLCPGVRGGGPGHPAARGRRLVLRRHPGGRGRRPRPPAPGRRPGARPRGAQDSRHLRIARKYGG